MRRILPFVISLLMVQLAFGQATIKGTLVDQNTNEGLIGASVVKKGTTEGTITEIDGSFMLTVAENTGVIEISYLGYATQLYTLDGSTTTYDLGTMGLASSSVGLEEVVITGVMDIVKDRMTPVAVSTIGTAEIQAKGGNVEFPELMKSTPSIYVAGQAGGYGDT